MIRMIFVLFCSFAFGCCCQRQMTVKSKFDPCNQARPVDSIEVQWTLTY
jgi:hypothetical protein